MTSPFFSFGDNRSEFAVPVINERVARAGAGLLLLFALVAFMNAWLMGNFAPTRLFVVAFLIDFTIRLFINPRLAPSLVIGQWLVRKQQPEWSGAPQKRFAWVIGFVLALTVFYLVVVQQMVGPVNLLVCLLCIALLFFETAFGICVGCAIYNRIHPEEARMCPGNACEYQPEPSQKISVGQLASLGVFVVAVGVSAQVVNPVKKPAAQEALTQSQPATSAASAQSAAEEERCKVPDFAKAMGHEEMWKKHNNCL